LIPAQVWNEEPAEGELGTLVLVDWPQQRKLIQNKVCDAQRLLGGMNKRVRKHRMRYLLV
jgi:hypothetical protein